MVVAERSALKDKTPQYFATTKYKLWVWARLRERFHNGKPWSLDRLAIELKRIDRNAPATSASLSQFLGPEGETPAGSNTSLMPAINKLFGIAPPPICDPLDPLSQLRDRLAARWAKLSDREQKMLETLLSEDDVTPDSDE